MTGRASDKITREMSRSVVPGHRVVQTSELARVGIPHTHAGGQTNVELIRDGDVVKAIDVTCSCGEKIRIWCSYAAE